MKQNKDTPIIMLHGLHGNPLSLWPLEKVLNWSGFAHTHRIRYANGGTLSLEASLDDAAKQILAVVGEDKPVILIGQSLGGLVAAHMNQKGIKVAHMITIASPLHGARLLSTLESMLPAFLLPLIQEEIYNFLKTKGKQPEPPHTYKTISMGWAWSSFDRLVYSDETMFDKKHHIHFTWMDHGFGILDPRLWYAVISDLQGRVH